MGTDITLIVEQKTDSGWVVVEPPPQWGPDDLEVVTRPLNSWESYRKHWFSDRNYELFAWLADERNRHGQEPLDYPRDIPEDSDAETFKALHGYEGLSWFTVAELQAGLVNLTVSYGGLVNEKIYVQWKESGEPFPAEWCQGTGAPSISEARYLAGERPQVGGPLAWAGFYVKCDWELPGVVGFKRFAKLLAHLATLGDPSDVRIVFGFG